MKWPWAKEKCDIELHPEAKDRLDDFDKRLTTVEERVKAMRAELQREQRMPGHA